MSILRLFSLPSTYTCTCRCTQYMQCTCVCLSVHPKCNIAAVVDIAFAIHYVLYSTVEYASREDMKNALRKLDGAELNGRKLKLTEDRGGSGGGGGYSRYKDRRYAHIP